MQDLVNWRLIGTKTMHPFSLIALLSLADVCNPHFIEHNMPCDFLDSINITNGALQSNKSIIYNGIEFPAGQYVNINYTVRNVTEIVPMPSYTRGCACNLKPCIRLCCPFGMIHLKSGVCKAHESAAHFKVFTEQYRNNQFEDVEVVQKFAFVDSYPCKRSHVNVKDEYIITAQGQVFLDNMILTQRKYCIEASLSSDGTNGLVLKLLVCNDSMHAPNDESIRYKILPFFMLLSVLFIIFTLIVYGCIPKLQNLNGKCVICYLATLAMGYTFLAGVQLNRSSYAQPLLCDSVGYLIYFTLLSAFLWLSVINFDLWLGFRSTSNFKRLNEHKQFFFYMIYGCGIPFLLTAIIVILDHVESIPKRMRPGIGHKSCFLYHTFLPQFFLFYLPVGIIILLNIAVYILTAIHFHQSRQQSFETERSQDDNSSHSQKFLNHYIDEIRLYLALFVIAGVAWILDIITFLAMPGSVIFLISDIWNCAQGFIIFVLLVMRRHMFQMIKERWNGLPGSSETCENLPRENNFLPNYFRMSSISDEM